MVHSDCPPDGPYQETITTVATPGTPRAGGTLRFELGVRRLQIDIGPMLEATYVFPVPAGVSRVADVDFADDGAHTWAVAGDQLTVRFRGPDGGWLVNDFPRLTVVAELSPALRPGDTVTWLPYLRFEQRFLNVSRPLACTVRAPAPVLQRLTVAG